MPEEKKEKRKDNDPSYVALRKMSLIMVNLLAKTSITPNQITIWGFIIFTPLIMYFFIKGSHMDNLIALGFMFISVILDLCDGALARMKSIQSYFGGWLDGSFDRMFQLLVFIAIAMGVALNAKNEIWYAVGFIVLFGQSMANFMGFCYEKDFNFDSYSGSSNFNSRFDECSGCRHFSILDIYLKNIIVPSNIYSIFFFTARYLLLIGVILNRLDWFLIIFAITINVRWISMWFLYIKILSKTKSNLYTVKFLNEVYGEKNIE